MGGIDRHRPFTGFVHPRIFYPGLQDPQRLDDPHASSRRPADGQQTPLRAEGPLHGQTGPGFSRPRRGDIVVFIFPDDPKRDFIKRLIAFGGETVEIKDGGIFINGKLIEDPVINKIYYYNRGDYGQEGQVIKVPEGQVYVLGDNSDRATTAGSGDLSPKRTSSAGRNSSIGRSNACALSTNSGTR